MRSLVSPLTLAGVRFSYRMYSLLSPHAYPGSVPPVLLSSCCSCSLLFRFTGILNILAVRVLVYAIMCASLSPSLSPSLSLLSFSFSLSLSSHSLQSNVVLGTQTVRHAYGPPSKLQHVAHPPELCTISKVCHLKVMSSCYAFSSWSPACPGCSSPDAGRVAAGLRPLAPSPPCRAIFPWSPVCPPPCRWLNTYEV